MKSFFALALLPLILISGCASRDSAVQTVPATSDTAPDTGQTTVTDPSQQACTPYNQFSLVEREITILSGQGGIIGPGHYQRLSDNLDCFARAGNDVSVLRQQLDVLNSTQAVPASNQTSNQVSSGAASASLPSCTGQQFTVAPVDMADVYDISPLGSINPPGHTFPTEHMYVHLFAGGQTTATKPLYAPADITILDITSATDELTGKDEYSMTFALCEDVFGYFNHVKGLSQELLDILATVQCVQWTVNPGNLCYKAINHAVAAGTVIGEVGSLQGNFDVGAYDTRTRLGYANPSSYSGRSSNIVCPLDLYQEPVRSQLYGKIKRTQEPRCGEVMLDLPGTLQGNWFYAGAASDVAGGAEFLAFVHESGDPAQAVISIGGTFASPGKWLISDVSSGVVNRKFSDVTPGNSIYCYSAAGQTGRLLVQLTSPSTLRIEHQSGPCSASFSFTSPATYSR